MCKDLKTSNFERTTDHQPLRATTTTTTAAQTTSLTAGQKTQVGRMRNRLEIVDDYPFNVDANQHRPTSFEIPLSNQFGQSAAHNLKFVLYIYEVKKMRDIYGRVTMALDVIKEKR